MKGLISQRFGYLELAAVDRGTGVHCCHRRNVTDRTTNILEQLSADETIGAVRGFHVARRRFGRTHELCEGFDVVSFVLRIGHLVVISHGVSIRTVFLWLQWARDSHFIEISVGGFRVETFIQSGRLCDRYVFQESER